jgi:cytochrome c oxidase subunit 4
MTERPSTRTHPEQGLGFVVLIGALLFLLALGTYLTSRVELGRWSFPVAMVFAGAKATLIALFYMGLVHQSGGARAAVAVTLTFLGVMIALVLGDLGFRFKPTLPPGPFPVVQTGDSSGPARSGR